MYLLVSRVQASAGRLVRVIHIFSCLRNIFFKYNAVGLTACPLNYGSSRLSKPKKEHTDYTCYEMRKTKLNCCTYAKRVGPKESGRALLSLT